METFCTTARHPKYRASLNANNFYQASTYSRNFRQNEYGFANSTRNSALLWHERPTPQTAKSKGKFCSIALAAAAFVVLVTVLSIAGLALYMGALRTVSTNPVVSYSCSVKVTRGDRFMSNLQEKGRKYRVQFESLYQRSVLGPSVVSCAIEKFGNDTFTIYFKLTLNRRKIPRHIYNVEKSIKDILLGDALNRRPVLRNIRFDPRSISIKQTLDSEPYQRVVTKSKDTPKPTRPGVILKPPNKSNATKKPTVQENNIKEEIFPVIHGSFKFSKTDADITQKKSAIDLNSHKINISISTAEPPVAVTLKDSSITSALFKLSISDKSSKLTTTTATNSTSSPKNKTTDILTEILKSTTSSTTTTEKINNNPILATPSNQAPWVPIYQNSEETVEMKTDEIPVMIEQEPIYTSFTNPGLSFHALDTEKLGSTSVQGHPLPVNKIADMTEPSIRSNQLSYHRTTEKTQDMEELYDLRNQYQNFTEVKTLNHVPVLAVIPTPIDPVTTQNNWQQVELEIEEEDHRLKQTTVLKNISSIFHSLASSLGIAPIHFNDLSKNYTTTNLPTVTDFPNPINNREEKDDFRVNRSEPLIGEGQVEVIDADEVTLLMQTTKEPLITLLPVKSNSGVGRPVRPRPKPQNDNLSENRSFPSDSYKLNLNDYSGVKYVETEVVTSVSSEQNRIKLSKNDYNVVGVLNFEPQVPNTEEATPAALVQTTTPEYKYGDERAVLSFNSSTSSHKAEGFQYLSQEKLKQLSEISKVSDNGSALDDGKISTKAVSSSYTINHAGFNILTKTFNKVTNSLGDEKKKAVGSYNSIYFSVSNKSECSNFTIKCGDGQCLPDTTRCNQLVDCNDGSDEMDCNCADYLRSQFLLRKICDGIVDCWDFSDENHCDWCNPGQYVCGNSKVCIDSTSICDGIRDCPHGDDERQCVTVAPTVTAADEFPYHSNGYLLVRKHGHWGKLCVENFENVVAKSQITWEISDLGQAVCKAMTYQALDNVKTVTEQIYYSNPQFYELAYSFQNETKSSLTFKSTTCDSGAVVKVKCQTLECGARPQATKQIARIVGGGNAGLGAWPWQAALYKEGEFQCGATLISDRWLLSAGHCFYHSLNDHWVARLGALRRGTALPSPYEQLRPIVDIILHQGYVDAGFINDISLLRMQVPVTFSDYVRPICLPPAGIAPRDGRMCTVIGWGQLFEIGRIFPDTLQEVQVPIISTAECRKRTLFLPLYRVTEDMFCAGYERGGRDACLGDSGGPLMCPEPDGRWILHGITSNGYGCARAYRPGVYTKVANYVHWIHSHVDREGNTTVTGKDTCMGHRCPLGECLPKTSLCNGFIECSDGSDEVGCLRV